jgi:hypothetical protein
MNQLLYGCEREDCNTPTCYSSRKRLPRNSSASRRLTLLSARIIAFSLASSDDPLSALCPGKPVVPTLEAQKNIVQFADQLEDEEKENRPDEAKATKGQRPRQKEVGLVTDKGLKDPRSFAQQLFSTVAMKMIEWIPLPPPTRTFSLSSRSSEVVPDSKAQVVEESKEFSLRDLPIPPPRERPKIKFPLCEMDVMDTGRLTKDSEPVTHTRYQEIMRGQPKKYPDSSRDVTTPTSHSNARPRRSSAVNTYSIPPPQLPPLGNVHPPPPQGWRTAQAVQITPSRGEKNTPSLWDAVETVAAPQSLKVLDENICKALMDMCHDLKTSPTQRLVTKQFAKQSIFYVLSTPEAVLASFGGIGSNDNVGFDPNSIARALDILYSRSWGEAHTKRSMWAGLAYVFAKPGKGISDRDAAGLIVLSLHVLSRALVQDDEVFRIVTELRASGTVSSKKDVAPDIGFDDELAERLAKRVLRALAFRKTRPGDSTLSYVQQYLQKCEQMLRDERNSVIAKEFGKDMVGQVNTGAPRGGHGLARCMLEWTRTIFMRNWDGYEIVKGDSLPGACVQVFNLLHSDYDSYGLFPELFETKTIGDRICPHVWPVDWYNGITPLSSLNDIHLLDHPYLIPVPQRVAYFRAINLDIMKKAYETAIANGRLTIQMSELTNHDHFLVSKLDTALSIYFVLAIRRSNLLEDALNQMLHREHRELIRPLKIKFQDGEEGVDQGGVQQEFFSLLMQEILKPEYGMFTTDDRTRLSWFWECSLEETRKFELVGLVVGLAVYNGITLPVNFPKALYVKLLGGTPTLDDIGDYWPELTRGLKDLLRWEDGDVGDVFVRTYEYSYSLFGKVHSINMLDAKKNRFQFLPQPIPPIEQKKEPRVRRRRGFVSRTARAWLPATHTELGAEDAWLGSLHAILDTINQQDEERRRQEEEDRQTLQEGTDRLRRLYTGQTSYTVTFTDLNTGETTESPEFVGVNNDSEDTIESAEVAEPEVDIDQLCAALIRLPSDDGMDWEECVPAYSPTSSIGAREEYIRPFDLQLENVFTEDPSTSSASSVAEKPTPDATTPSEETAASSVSFEPAAFSIAQFFSEAAPDPGLEPATDESEAPEVTFAPDAVEDEPEPEAPLVTNANRAAFVDDYISWLTDRSIRRQYEAFARGFFSVNNLRSLSLFTPTSLQALVEGAPDAPIDIAALEAVCKYEDGYHAGHRVIRDFWQVVRGFSEERKRLLLEFVTSSSRVPIGGIGNVMFHIVRSGDDTERLPTSLTCFGRLLLPEYASRRKLREKLKLALENSRGFGSP